VTLEAHDLCAGYGRLEVLHGVSLGVPPEGAVAILGPNGAGKSTLLKVLARELPLMSGHLLLGGDDYGERDATWAARNGIALVPQTGNVFPDLTVRENLRLGAMRRADGSAAIDRATERFPVLAERASQLAGSLSGGERQMLAIASALLLEPKVLLLDEPTTGLSPKAAAATSEIVAEISAGGTAVVWVVEQMPELVLRQVEHVYVMAAGRVQHEGPPEEFLVEGRLEQMLLQHT
jgi:ABC-type branched-subunit amino acid transport system ATPase component